jgi:hypothetical protein
MRTVTTPEVPAVHRSPRPHPRRRTGPVAAAALLLAAACAAIVGATAHAATPPSLHPLAVVVGPASPRIQLKPLRVVPAVVVPTAAPPTLTPSAGPGQVKGIRAPSLGILPPVAILPTPSPRQAATQPSLQLALLGSFVAILLAATLLTARRRL